MSQRIQSRQTKEESTMRSIKVAAAIVALGAISLSPLRAAPGAEPTRPTDRRIQAHDVARAEGVADFYDATDLAALLARFGCDDCPDLDGDRDIDADDIRLMLGLLGSPKPRASTRSDDANDEEHARHDKRKNKRKGKHEGDDDGDDDDDDDDDEDDDDDDNDDDDDDDDDSEWRPPVGQNIPDFGFEWATIKALNNKPVPFVVGLDALGRRQRRRARAP